MADFKRPQKPNNFTKSGGRPPVQRHKNPYNPKENAPRKFAEPNDEADNLPDGIEGRNAVIEALKAEVPLDKVYILKGDDAPTLRLIASKARAAGAVVVDADRRKLDAMSRTHAHQGVIATTPAAEYVEISDILNIAKAKGEQPLVIVCDEISDPHNLGAIIRTAEASGAHGVIIPKRRSAGLTAIVAKTSAGAAFHVPTARVANISAALEELKRAGVWIYGAAADGEKSLWETDLTGSAAIVIGSEGEGISRLVKENCDFIVSIPMSGKMASLNASVSAAVLMYEAVRQRTK
ncbi:MAG: 23S rRNA (guanosine(2251)-2'-O)-methyltransferase RlmB [Oscillospiraceae bacterium]|jgi:23S rRNA (guanosine2251-2'-O)-methyltransferase|nr:23S rRNA (guanosine(2251)-2'-O)-methyltransferase RlmB [Oscillospiraceae bacterium]